MKFPHPSLLVAVCLLFTTPWNVVAAQTDIARERAERIALELVPDATVESVERDEEDGVDVYEVELVTDDGVEHEVTIDAQTGRVLRVEVDD